MNLRTEFGCSAEENHSVSNAINPGTWKRGAAQLKGSYSKKKPISDNILTLGTPNCITDETIAFLRVQQPAGS